MTGSKGTNWFQILIYFIIWMTFWVYFKCWYLNNWLRELVDSRYQCKLVVCCIKNRWLHYCTFMQCWVINGLIDSKFSSIEWAIDVILGSEGDRRREQIESKYQWKLVDLLNAVLKIGDCIILATNHQSLVIWERNHNFLNFISQGGWPQNCAVIWSGCIQPKWGGI